MLGGGGRSRCQVVLPGHRRSACVCAKILRSHRIPVPHPGTASRHRAGTGGRPVRSSSGAGRATRAGRAPLLGRARRRRGPNGCTTFPLEIATRGSGGVCVVSRRAPGGGPSSDLRRLVFWRVLGMGFSSRSAYGSASSARRLLPRSPLAALWAPLRAFAGVGRGTDRPGAHGRFSRLGAARMIGLRESLYCIYL